MKIYKYPLKVLDEQVIEFPVGAQILALKAQDNLPQIWAAVEPDAKLEKRTFHTFGTGHTLPADMSRLIYIDTYVIPNLVFHVFELIGG